MSKEIQPHWYKIKGIWYHCITTENGDRYVNGEKQNVDDYSFFGIKKVLTPYSFIKPKQR